MQGECAGPVPDTFGFDSSSLLPGQCVLLTSGAFVTWAAAAVPEDTWLSNLFISQDGGAGNDVVSLTAEAADAARLWMTNCTLEGPTKGGGLGVTDASAYVAGAPPGVHRFVMACIAVCMTAASTVQNDCQGGTRPRGRQHTQCDPCSRCPQPAPR